MERLRHEESVYRTVNEGHRRHFEAMSVPLGTVGVAASGREAAVGALAQYQSALDLPIVRVLADHDGAALHAVADASAP